MHLLTLLLAFAQIDSTRPLVDIQDLTPREHRSAGILLTAALELRIVAVGAEPRLDRRREGRDDDSWWNDDERVTWPAAAWIIDARTREVVWDLRAVNTERDRTGVRRFNGTLRLPAGTYEVHYGSFASTSESWEGDVSSVLRGFVRGRGRVTYRGPYVDDGSYRDFGITIRGAGRPATTGELDAAARAFAAASVVSLQPDQSAAARAGFELTRPTAIEVYAIGEIRRDGEFDYGWIQNADTRAVVWRMDYEHTEPAGGAQKNRESRETLRLPAGRYVAYFVSDDSHDPEEWNHVPPFDPAFWGLSLRVTDAAARAAVRPFAWEPVPAGQTLVSLTRIGDRETKSTGFTLRQPLDVRVYAIGEGTDREMVDYAWIVDAGSHARVWTMRYQDTEHAGGADKNRLFDGVVHLAPGSYMVYYTSDGSHSYENWNSAPPAEDRHYGVSVFPASGRLQRSGAGPFDRPARRTQNSELLRMGHEERARANFRLDRDMVIRVHAVGEGDDTMYDYGWIEDAATGRVVWEMTYCTTDPAGGARKNREFDGTIRLPAGNYLLRYRSDGSHAYGDWNDDPPQDPEAWGIAVYRIP